MLCLIGTSYLAISVGGPPEATAQDPNDEYRSRGQRHITSRRAGHARAHAPTARARRPTYLLLFDCLPVRRM